MKTNSRNSKYNLFINNFGILMVLLVFPYLNCFQDYFGSIKGRVLDKNGNPLIASMRLTNITTKKEFISEISVEKNGFFELKLLPVGFYDININSQGFVPFYEANVQIFKERITLFEFKLISFDEVGLKITEGEQLVEIITEKDKLYGKILNKYKKPIWGATIEIFNKDIKLRKQVTSNKEGAYVLENINEGKYELIIKAKGYKAKKLKDIVISNKYSTRYNIILESN